MTKKLTKFDIIRAAQALGVVPAVVQAVLDVEAGSDGFLADGRVKVQYEPHVMYQRLTQRFGRARADAELAKHPDLVALKPGSYQRLDKEDQDMDRAATLIDRTCALESASWGLPQIMGYHWVTCGYASLQAFINEMSRSEGGQLNAFVKFILADSVLLGAIRARNWTVFARRYNGPAYAKNQYDSKLANAFSRRLAAWE